jgi:hypothetical protein
MLEARVLSSSPVAAVVGDGDDGCLAVIVILPRTI